MKTGLDDAELLREYARIDWLYAGTRWDRLHCPTEFTPDAEQWCLRDVEFACGWKVAVAAIPGVFSRMALMRCARCCDKQGMPRGKGSPKNDDVCRQILGLAS